MMVGKHHEFFMRAKGEQVPSFVIEIEFKECLKLCNAKAKLIQLNEIEDI